MNKKNKSVTLIELLVSITIVSIMILSFYGLEALSQSWVINAERRAKVQNELSNVLEHMSKYVQTAYGDKNHPPVVFTESGFKVQVDFKSQQTPWDLINLAWVSYSLDNNTLSTSCAAIGSGTCGSFAAETLSKRIISGVSNTEMPNPLPSPLTAGFYVKIDPDDTGAINIIEIGLVGRYKPTEESTSVIPITNPQIEMKTKIICNSCSTN